MNLQRATVVAFLWACFVTQFADAGNIYVEATAVPPFDGSPSHPFLTITQALDQGSPVINDVILVKPGTYNTALGESWPLHIPNGVDVKAYDSGNRPHIGGDTHLDSPDAAEYALVVVDATGAERSSVDLENLYFIGENISGYDAPGAVYVRSAGGHQAVVTVTNCLIERSAMNNSTLPDKPAVRAIGGRRVNATTPSLILTVDGCAVGATAAGGVVVDLGPDATDADSNRGYIQLNVSDNSFVFDGAAGSLSAIDYFLEGYSGTTPLFADGECTIERNLVDSRACSGEFSRFANGIRIGGIAKYGGLISMNRDLTILNENDVRGCAGAGITFHTESDGDPNSDVEVQSFYFHNNRMRDNLGSGLVLDWGDGINGTYLRVLPKGCLIVDNHDGVELREAIDGIGLSGTGPLLNCTITGNTGYGVKMVTSVGTVMPSMLGSVENCIIYDNGSGSALGWQPSDVLFKWNDFEGLCTSPPCSCSTLNSSNPNMDVWPAFADAPNGDYHLTANSCCIDQGTNRPEGGANGIDWLYDIDGRARKMDGNHPDCNQPAVPVIDIGADEFPDPCAE